MSLSKRKKFSLASLQAAFEPTKKANDGRFYDFFNIDYDSTCTVRLLPDADEDNPLQFIVEKKTHSFKVGDKYTTMPCLEQYDEECPACEASRAFYKNEQKEKGKAMYRKSNHIANVMVMDDPMTDAEGNNQNGKIKQMTIGYQVLNVIKEGIGDPDTFGEDESLYDLDLIIKKTKKSGYANYELGTKFARKASPLTAKQEKQVDAEIVDLKTMLPPKPDVEKFTEKFEEALAELMGDD